MSLGLKQALGVFAFFLLCFLPSMPFSNSGDGLQYVQVAQNLVDYADFFWYIDEHTGQKVYSHFGLLLAFWLYPFLWSGRILEAATGIGFWPMAMSGFASCALVALCGLSFFYVLKSYQINSWKSFLGTMAFVFSSMFWMYSQATFTEPLSALLAILGFLSLRYYGQAGKGFWVLLCGLCLALSVHAKFVNMVTLFVPFALYFWAMLREQKMPWAGMVKMFGLFAGPFMVAVLALLAVNYYKFGLWQLTYVGGRADPSWIVEAMFGFLLSPGRSLFMFNLPLLVSVLVFCGFAQKYRSEALFIAAAVFVNILLFGCSSYWHAGHCWGPRYFLPLIPFFYLPCLLFWLEGSFKGWFRVFYKTLLGLSIAVQALAVLIPFQTWTQIVYDHGGKDSQIFFLPRYSHVRGNFVLAGDFYRSLNGKPALPVAMNNEQAFDLEPYRQANQPSLWIWKIARQNFLGQSEQKQQLFSAHPQLKAYAWFVLIGIFLGIALCVFWLRRLMLGIQTDDSGKSPHCA